MKLHHFVRQGLMGVLGLLLTVLPNHGVPQERSSRPELVKMSVFPHTANLIPLYLGIESGQYRAEGIDLKLILFEHSLSIKALLNEDLDYTFSIGSVIRAAGAGLPVRLIMTINNSIPWVFMVRPGISSLQDLKGKIVSAGSLTASNTFVFKRGLRQFGLDPERDVIFNYIARTEIRMATILRGQLDAAAFGPLESRILKQRGYKELFDFGEIEGVREMPWQGVATSAKKIKVQYEQVKRMIRATLKGMRYTREQRNEAVELIMRRFKEGRETASLEYDTWLQKIASRDGSVSERGLYLSLDLAREGGARIATDLPLTQVADLDALKEVQRELGLRP